MLCSAECRATLRRSCRSSTMFGSGRDIRTNRICSTRAELCTDSRSVSNLLSFFPGPNEVWGKVLFLLSCWSVHRGGGYPSMHLGGQEGVYPIMHLGRSVCIPECTWADPTPPCEENDRLVKKHYVIVKDRWKGVSQK